jgi:Rrf2 family protein
VRLSRETRYAISGLLALAAYPPGEHVDTRRIAAAAGLPAPYLQKILRQLSVAGIVSSRRGSGFALVRGPAAVTMRDVIEAIEGPEVFGGRCIFWREECSTEEPCVLHFRWRELKPEVEDAIARTTLAEVRAAGGELAMVDA